MDERGEKNKNEMRTNLSEHHQPIKWRNSNTVIPDFLMRACRHCTHLLNQKVKKEVLIMQLHTFPHSTLSFHPHPDADADEASSTTHQNPESCLYLNH